MVPPQSQADLVEGLLQQPLFEGLSKKHRELMLEFAKIVEFPAGTDFIRQGEYTRDFFVVISGIVTAYRTEKSGKTEVYEQLGPGKWFGELSALSNQPALARLKADTACVLAVLDGGLFKELHKDVPKAMKDRGKVNPFRERVEALYRKRSLAQHLRVVPLLSDLESELLRKLRSHATFEQYDKDQVVAQSGEPADRIILVRSGGLTRTRKDTSGKEHLVGYLMANSSFGEHAFLGTGGQWEGTYTALMATDALVLPIAAIQETFANQPEIIETLQRTARLIVAEDAGIHTGYYDIADGDTAANAAANAKLDEQLEIMVHGESIKGGEALAIDLEKCVRCNACVESCVAVHDDGIPRLSKKGNRITAEGNAMGKELSLTTSCYHCETPGCMMACDYGAIRRDSEGLIRFVWDNCVGCAECTKGCPYDVIRLTPPPGSEQEGANHWLSNLPLIGGLFSKRERPALSAAERGYYKEQEVKGKAVKCDRCEGLPFEACVYNCPCGAIERVPPALIFDQSLSDIAAGLPEGPQ